MNRSVFFVLICAIMLTAYSALWGADVKSTVVNSGSTATVLSRSNDNGCRIDYKITEILSQTNDTKDGNYNQLDITGYGTTNRIGMPRLPMLRKMLSVPLGADVRATVLSRKEKEYKASELGIKYPLMPGQRSVFKNEDPNTIPFAKDNSIYNTDRYNDDPTVSITEMGFMRGVRLVAIDFEPVRYNPVQNKFMVVTEISVDVDFVGGDLTGTRELLEKTASYEFDRVYEKVIFNWRNNERATLMRYPTKIVILTPASYVTTLQTFIDWKKQQGYTVIVQNIGTGTGEVANTTTAIKTYLQGLWDTATAQNPAPTFMLIVGDTGQITSNTGVTNTSHVTDLTYVRLQGTDYIPELYFGRFSAETTAQLQAIIDKTLMFEKTLMPDLNYLGQVVMIAGVDATYGPTHGNGQINYGTANYFNATNGITSTTYLYPASGSSDAQIIANASEGRGYINYTAHGSETSWADPTFSVTDVNALTNTNKYFVAVGNCCVTNKFNYTSGPCFGEAMIRASNKGAAAYIGANNNSLWDEDYWWGVGYKGTATGSAPAYSASTLGAYDAMFHTHSEALENWAQTTGEIVFMGNSAVQQSASSNAPYYWEIYSIMGDPTLMPYLGVPTVNTATYPNQILIGATSATITAEPQSRVAITMGGVLYGTGIVGTSGTLNLTITPFTSVGTASVVITRQNKRTIIGSISVIPNSGAYVTLDSWTYADSNNNTAEFSETGRFNATFRNVGSVAATNVNCTLTTTNPGITLTDNTEAIASLAAGASITITSAFTFNTANNIADQTAVPFSLAMVSGTNTWNGNINLTLNAPALAFGAVVITDPTGNNNGRLDPGETVTVTIPLQNNGHATSIAGTGTLTCSTTGITITTGSAAFGTIAASGSSNLVFGLSVSASMSIGSVAALVFNAVSGGYTATKNENTAVGIIQENFETGNFSAFPWTLGGTLPWTVANTGAHAGTYTAKSGTITHSQVSSMETIRNLTTAGNITFWYSVSSEPSYDYLKFYIDGTLQTSSWSGTVSWTQATFAVAAGTHTLKWEYSKDGSVSSNSDCAWVDDIVFPASTASYVFNPPQNLTAIASHAKVALTWSAPSSGTPSSYKVFRGGTLLTTVTALTYNDTAVTNGTAYSYYVTAVYTSPAGESAATSTVSATPVALPPVSLTAVGGNNTVALNWMAPTAGTPSGYKVYRNSALLATITALTHTDNTAVNGTSYTYYVTATYTSPTGESAASNTVSVTPSVITNITIGTGTTTNQSLPIEPYYGYTYSQSIYLQSEINLTNKRINKIAWQYNGNSTWGPDAVKIWMGHTANTAFASTTSWLPVSGLTLVFNGTLSVPATAGWVELTLSTPFTYNNTSNLVIAVDENTSGYHLSADEFYCTAITGNRSIYYYSDTVNPDPTTPVTAAATPAYIPNVKLFYEDVPSLPAIRITTAALAFGDVAVGSSASRTLLIENTGGAALTGSFSTPAGYTSGSVARSESRNTQNFTIPAGQSLSYSITLAPTQATTYNSVITVNSNDATNPAVQVTLTGTGYIPPTVTLNDTSFDASVVSGESTEQTLVVGNTGSRDLTYSIQMLDTTGRTLNANIHTAPVAIETDMTSERSIAGTTFVVDATEYLPGTTLDWTFTVVNGSTDTEWLKNIQIQFPAGVTVNSSTSFVGGSGGDMASNAATGNGALVIWHGEDGSGWGLIHGAETGVATVNVTIGGGFSGDLEMPYQIDGDIFGAEPHLLTGTLSLESGTPPVTWLSCLPASGTVAAGQTQNVILTFDSFNIPDGLYSALLTINTNDPSHPAQMVDVTMNVASGNHSPAISLPADFSFNKNASLNQSFAAYVTDADNDPLTLSVSGNQHVQVQISGLSVTFTADYNWIGSEVMSFTVSDGVLTSSDNIVINVLPVNQPVWTPVVYPNNSATVYAVVTLEGLAAAADDLVGAFAGAECRAVGNVTIQDNQAFVTLLVNLAFSSETITFKVYDSSTDVINTDLQPVTLGFGEVLGDTVPYPIDVISGGLLEEPVVTITSVSSGVRLDWSPVVGAESYQIQSSIYPDSGFSIIASTETNTWETLTADLACFYRVVAIGGNAVRK